VIGCDILEIIVIVNERNIFFQLFSCDKLSDLEEFGCSLFNDLLFI
jgi:hypothetical protein